MDTRNKKCLFCAGGLFVVTLVLSAIWHERHRWSWPATWITGTVTTGLGFLNSNAAALGVLITLAFGVLNWVEGRRRTRAVLDSAKAGTLNVGETEQ